MIPTFLVTILTLLTLTTIIAMSSNVDQVEAQTNTASCNALDPNPSAECDVTIDYDGNCSPTAANCDIDINVVTNPPPSGANELRLNYLLETGIFCNNVAGGSAGRTACLANTLNDYDSTVTVNRGPNTVSDNQFNFQGSQQIRETDGQDNFRASNIMGKTDSTTQPDTFGQTVRVNTIGEGSVVDTDGEGDNFQLQYLQDIVQPDDTTNTNLAGQFVGLAARDGGIIDTSEHSELGFRVEQRLLDIDDGDTNQASSPITATNRALQVLGIGSDNGAEVQYDTNGLSLVSQTIDDCSFTTTGTTDCLNSAGDPTLSPDPPDLNNGQRVQLSAAGAGTTIDVDNLRQLLNQNIDNFLNANGNDATNRADSQLFLARATNGGDIDMALADVTEQTQSISQSITNSDENTLNRVAPITSPPGDPSDPELRVGQGIFIGDDPRTATQESVLGLVEADVDQELTQSINGITNPPTTGTLSASNTGTMTITLLAKEGPSELFVEGFNQYLRQTASNCSNCHNNGQVHATFEVTDAATFTLEEGSTQGLTQTVTQNGMTNTNAVISTISVSGDGTEANIGLEQELTATNGNRQGNPNSIFTASYSGGQEFNQQCNINSFGTFTQVNDAGPCS